MLFRYRAYIDEKIITGKIDAQSQQEALEYLRKQDMLTIEIGPANLVAFTYFLNLLNRPSSNDILHFTRQLAIMMNSGLTVIDSIEILKKQTSKQSLFRVIERISRRVRSGETFSSSLMQFPHLFSNLFISLIKAGEASGKVNDVLTKLAENLEKQREFNAKMRNSLIYPIIIVIGMIVVMFVMITFVLPELLGLYTDLSIDLPISTKMLIALSNFSTTFWPFIVIAVIMIGVSINWTFRTAKGKRILDVFLLKIPVIGNVIRMAALVDSTRTLSILIASGVSILEALQIIIETTSNSQYQKAFANVYKHVEKGVSLAESMTKEEIFPPILIQMTTVGEQTGKLDETWERISSYFEFESEYAIKALTSLIEPAIIVILGIGVGLLVISVITPIYNLTTNF